MPIQRQNRNLNDELNELYRRMSRVEINARRSHINLNNIQPNGATTYASDTPPTGAKKDDLWINTANNNVVYKFDGTNWIAVLDPSVDLDRDFVAYALAIIFDETTEAAADGNARAYYQEAQPVTTSSNAGDLWLKPSTRVISRSTGSSWANIGYTNDDLFTKLASDALSLTIADSVIRAWWQFREPTATGFGDIWINTSVTPNTLWRWNNYDWVQVLDWSSYKLNTVVTSKITTYYTPTTPVSTAVGDIWYNTASGNQAYRASTVGASTISSTGWVSVQDASIAAASAAAVSAQTRADNAMTAAQAAQATADGAIRTYYQSERPWPDGSSGHANDAGDMWFDTDDNQAYRWNDSTKTWQVIEDNSISQALAAAQNAQTTADGKITAYYQTTQPTIGELGDLWYDTDDKNKPYYCSSKSPLTWTPVRDGTIADAKSAADAAAAAAGTAQTTADAATKPTTPPADLANVQVFAASGGAAVFWDPPQDVRVRVRLFVTDDNTKPKDATTLWSNTIQNSKVISTVTATGAALDPTATYFFALQPYYLNPDGAEISGAITEWQEGQAGVYFSKLISSQAIIESLQAQTIDSVELRGATGTFDDLVTQGKLTIYGGDDSTVSGTLIASLGVTTPNPPQVALDWDYTPLATNMSGTYPRGLTTDGTYWWAVECGRKPVDGYVLRIDKTTGVMNRFRIAMGDTTSGGILPLGISYYNGFFYILYYYYPNGSIKSKFGVARWNGDTASGAATQITLQATAGLPLVGQQIFMYNNFIWTASTVDTQVQVQSYNMTTGALSGSGIACTKLPGRTAVTGLYIGPGDFGSNRIIYSGNGQVLSSDTSGTDQPSEKWPIAELNDGGVFYDNGQFHTILNSRIYHYTGNLSGATDVAITWRDNDPAGLGTAETLASKRTQVVVKRQRISVRLPSAPPNDGTTDGANTAAIYMSSRNGQLKLQRDLNQPDAETTGPFYFYTAPLTSGDGVKNDPTYSGFEGRPGGIGRYQPAAKGTNGKPLWQLNGDGTYSLDKATNVDDIAPVQVTLASGFTVANSNTPTAQRVNRLSNFFGNVAGSYAASSVYTIGTIPTNLAPAAQVNRQLSSNSAVSTVRGVINPSGSVQVVTGPTAPVYVDLSGFSGYLIA